MSEGIYQGKRMNVDGCEASRVYIYRDGPNATQPFSNRDVVPMPVGEMGRKSIHQIQK